MVGLIGFGAIGHQVAQGIASGAAGDTRLVGILVRKAQERMSTVPVFTDLAAFLATRPQVVLEAAGPVALAGYAEPILSSGAVLIAASAGALLDPALRTRLETVCRQHRSRLYVPAGALGGLDALAAAAVGGLDEVTLRIVEPGDAEQVIFCGDALDGAQRFPARLNVAVAASLAAAGGVQVELSQQRVDQRAIELTARGAFGDMRIQLNLRPAPNRVSHIVALSLLSTLKRLQQPLVVG